MLRLLVRAFPCPGSLACLPFRGAELPHCRRPMRVRRRTPAPARSIKRALARRSRHSGRCAWPRGPRAAVAMEEGDAQRAQADGPGGWRLRRGTPPRRCTVPRCHALGAWRISAEPVSLLRARHQQCGGRPRVRAPGPRRSGRLCCCPTPLRALHPEPERARCSTAQAAFVSAVLLCGPVCLPLFHIHLCAPLFASSQPPTPVPFGYLSARVLAVLCACSAASRRQAPRTQARQGVQTHPHSACAAHPARLLVSLARSATCRCRRRRGSRCLRPLDGELGAWYVRSSVARSLLRCTSCACQSIAAAARTPWCLGGCAARCRANSGARLSHVPRDIRHIRAARAIPAVGWRCLAPLSICGALREAGSLMLPAKRCVSAKACFGGVNGPSQHIEGRARGLLFMPGCSDRHPRARARRRRGATNNAAALLPRPLLAPSPRTSGKGAGVCACDQPMRRLTGSAPGSRSRRRSANSLCPGLLRHGRGGTRQRAREGLPSKGELRRWLPLLQLARTLGALAPSLCPASGRRKCYAG
ncbi:hypothetical protein FA09DRAFT_145710 [Tilletiopsis washingtonensis]|uniref:Uncharacterized protein n=1 Tax=Tilletiopsis washingtonensis TaxID=58919 RepID=A0A316Z1P1_9BASI|nr:hypothetical protein FA09DRAFT_145710 [Tilletiopsis washingtonensis]PWN95276.1 hypothetical protein FA09DRAFT_145710 [Tilletiopsis washingtonensis]